MHSNLTQWKRAGLITLKSLDRNQELLFVLFVFLLGRRRTLALHLQVPPPLDVSPEFRLPSNKQMT